MREILFKAKRIDNGEWVYGNLFKNLWATRIIPVTSELDAGELSELFLVNPSTICEFTGLTDKNGVKIFEGDEIEYYSSRQYVQQSHPDINPEINEPYLVKIKSMVEFNECGFGIKTQYDGFCSLQYVGFSSTEECVEHFFGDINLDDYFGDDETPCDINGNNINESIIGIEVIGNIHEKTIGGK